MHPPARFATVPTPPGPFTVVVATLGGTETVLASGWTDDVSELLPVVHRSLRPTWVERADSLPVLDTVEAFVAGILGDLGNDVLRRHIGNGRNAVDVVGKAQIEGADLGFDASASMFIIGQVHAEAGQRNAFHRRH